MKGLELSSAYFEEYGRPMIDNQLAQYKEYIAAGLVGEGSECLGFDDELSVDHDFGPSFCIWVPENIYKQVGTQIQNAYDCLPQDYRGYRRITSAQGGGRVGVMSIENFYLKYTGYSRAPEDNMEWFRIPESFLATVTNGKVFMDNLGTFSNIRASLKSFYPTDVVKKKLASRCAYIAQSGQYNYPRCMNRGDNQAAYLACGEFTKNVLGILYLLNETYMPYYKWMFRGTENFRILHDCVDKLRELVMIPDTTDNGPRKSQIIESICVSIGMELNRRGYTRTTDAFLQTHGEELMRGIEDSRLRNMHIMVDVNR